MLDFCKKLKNQVSLNRFKVHWAVKLNSYVARTVGQLFIIVEKEKRGKTVCLANPVKSIGSSVVFAWVSVAIDRCQVLVRSTIFQRFPVCRRYSSRRDKREKDEEARQRKTDSRSHE